MELFNDGFIIRYFHIWFGIIWIGTLYYFNFMQTPFFGETDGSTKSGVISKLLPRALWWFRWGAMFTFLTGLYLLGKRWLYSAEAFSTIWAGAGGVIILVGALLGITMFLNVWLIIWPKQQIVMASNAAVLAGGKADPNAAAAGARAGVASRTNTLFSVPMLFMMTAAAHNQLQVDVENSMYKVMLAVIVLSWAAIEGNAIWGKMVKPLATVKAVITSGFVLTIVYYGLIRAVAVM